MTTVKVMVDSGAYSAWSRKVTIDLDQYIGYLQRNEHLLDSYFNLDVIPGADGGREWRPDHIERAAESSYKNLQRMKAAGLSPIPVFHQDEDYRWLKQCLAYGESYIALAPFDGGYDAIPWLHNCFALLSQYPQVKVHGLGMTTRGILHRFPWYSVDSTTWIKQAGAHLIPVPLCRNGRFDYSSRDVISLGDQPHGKHIDHLDEFDLAWVHRFLKEVVGIELAEARSSHKARWRVWITFFKQLEPSISARIIFATSVNEQMRQTLLQCHAQYHLLSYHVLRSMLGDKLQHYVTRR
jgi:hypothetical protein